MALAFESSRLKVSEIEDDFELSERIALLEKLPEILTPSVVENLPPYFHGIESQELAEVWLNRMLLESRLFIVRSKADTLIGFLFAFIEYGLDAHIGYLLAEEYWGKGLASELLQSFIEGVSETECWHRLIGGVEQSNTASANLLKKLGFVESISSDSSVVFYEYLLHKEKSQ